LRNFGASPKFFFDVLVVWGVIVHPKKPRKIVGKASLPCSGPGKKSSLGVKLSFFCPWDQFSTIAGGSQMALKLCFYR